MARRDARTPSPSGINPALNGQEGPITPRNDAGPWVFDGSGVRVRDGETTVVGAPSPQIITTSIDAAANDEMDVGGA
jgi:hypothetical protein